MKNITWKEKVKAAFPQLLVILALVAVGGACGKKDKPVASVGGPAVYAPPPINNNPTTVPPPTTTYAQIAQNIVGTYRGSLYTHSGAPRGTATIKLNANSALGVSLTVTHSSLSPHMAVSLTPYSISGTFIYYNVPWNGAVGQIDGHQVWVSGLIIDYASPAVPRLLLTVNSVEYDYNSFGPWDLFHWETFGADAPGWIRLDSVYKVGPL